MASVLPIALYIATYFPRESKFSFYLKLQSNFSFEARDVNAAGLLNALKKQPIHDLTKKNIFINHNKSIGVDRTSQPESSS
jgi:hypothetical protein